MDWIATIYDSDDEIIKQFLIKDRTEQEAFNEVESPITQIEGYSDWTLMPKEFWEKQDVDISNIEEL